MKKAVNQELPYERFLRFGAESLTEAELLAIILRTGTRDCNAVELARQILSLGSYPNEGLLGLHQLSLDELQQVKGIGEVKAVKLKALTELALRFSRASARKGLEFHTPSTVASYYMEKLRHRNTECVYLLCLDAKGLLLAERRISDGSVHMSLISPREIFMQALQCKAVHIMLVHNHPSGDPTPSSADIEVTRNLKELGERMDIPLLDHIIIGDNRYSSFKELSYI